MQSGRYGCACGSPTYRANVALDRVRVEHALAPILERAPEVEVRLVGTASSLLRGIDMPASDIDILFRDRAGVDAWFTILSADLDVEGAPEWIADAGQYFTRLRANDVVIELSTVETESDIDELECVGAGPWRYFDLVACGARIVPTVATELRLITEFTRGREDRYRPIVDHLRAAGCYRALVRRGLANVGVTQTDIDEVLADLSPPALS
jgi:hypothetical protein